VSADAWRCSLHGGHSGEFCDHAQGTLAEVVAAAAAAGLASFGLSEHAPRLRVLDLYPAELAMGWDLDTLQRLFGRYAAESRRLQQLWAGRLTLLRGFESEVVTTDRWLEVARGWRRLHGFQFVVGSVHHVRDVIIDLSPELLLRAAEACGGLEALVVEYYGSVADMATRLRPEVVGHLDLPRRHAEAIGMPDTPATRAAEAGALEAIRDAGCILDLNTAAWRKGLSGPYPAPRLVQQAHALGIGFCFGDDSHAPEQVGLGLDRGRDYLLGCGVGSITTLVPATDDIAGPLEPRVISLDG
jgi:histidinol-phosphatase (PHP family)